MKSGDQNPAIAEQGAEQLSHTAVPHPGTEAELELASIWQKLFELESVATDQNFFDLGGDSSLAVRMFAEIENRFGVKLPLAILYESPTIAELAPLLNGQAETSGWSPLVPIQTDGLRPPLFCFHGAGGNVLIYRDLSKHLGANQPVYGLQAQGLDGELPPLTSIEEMAALYLKEIRKAQPYGPYFLCGYCGGGTIAYEAAQQLHAIGERVALLAMFDTMNWSKIPITLWSKTAYAVQRLIFHGATFLSLGWKDKSKFLHEKAEVLRGRLPVWRGYLQSKFKKTSGDAQSISVALARIWQINDAACWEYLPKPFAGRVTDFRPSKQYRIFDKPELKWDALAQGGQDVVVLPVYPASMLIEPFVENLAAALEKSIDRAISAEDTRAFAAPQEKRGDAW